MVSFFLALMLNTHVLALPPLRCNRHLSNHTRSARRYYVNTLTDETSWEKPSAEELNAAAVSQRGNLSDHDNLIVAVLSVLANMMYENDANIGRFIAASGVPTYVFLRVYVSASFDCGLFKSRSLCLYGALSLATAGYLTLARAPPSPVVPPPLTPPQVREDDASLPIKAEDPRGDNVWPLQRDVHFGREQALDWAGT